MGSTTLGSACLVLELSQVCILLPFIEPRLDCCTERARTIPIHIGEKIGDTNRYWGACVGSGSH